MEKTGQSACNLSFSFAAMESVSDPALPSQPVPTLVTTIHNTIMQIITTNNLQNIVLRFAALRLQPPSHPPIPPPFATPLRCSNLFQAGNHYPMFQEYIIFTIPQILEVTVKKSEQMIQLNDTLRTDADYIIIQVIYMGKKHK